MTQLKPCPFCGSEAAFGTVRYGAYDVREMELEQDTYHFCSCTLCGVSNQSLLGYATPDNAAIAWNTRANVDQTAREALIIAEAFMSGFEGDEAQEGLDAKLVTVRAALSAIKGEH